MIDVRRILCTPARRVLGGLCLVFAATSAGAQSQPDEFTYTDGRYAIEYRYAPAPSELLVRFDGSWTEAEREAFEIEWSLTPSMAFVESVHLGIYATSQSPARLADAIRAAAPTNRLLEGRGVRMHPGLLGEHAGPVRVVPGQALVRFRPEYSDDEARAVIASFGGDVLRDFWTPGYYRVGLPSGIDLFREIQRLNDSEEIWFASPDLITTGGLLDAPDDPMYGDQWHFENTGQLPDYVVDADVDGEMAWDVTRGDSTAALVSVIDLGVLLAHPDLADNILERPLGHDWDYQTADSTGNPSVTGRHGTQVAGVAAAVANNLEGITGMAPEITILPLRAEITIGAIAQRVDAINYSVSWKGQFQNVIINCSWSTGTGNPDDPGLRAACDDADAAGCLVVAASGNDGDTETELKYPARYASTFAVGGTTPCDTRYVTGVDPGCAVDYDINEESNYGPMLDVVAPGIAVLTTNRPVGAEPDYAAVNGTSFAAPLVSGLAGLVWTVDPTLTVTEVKDLIRQTAEDEVGWAGEDTPGFDEFYGWGRVNAYAALRATGSVRGAIVGRVRGVTELVKLDTDTLVVNSILGDTHDYRISDVPVNAQDADTVHVFGVVDLFDIADTDATVVEFGLITTAQRDSALVIEGDAEHLFDQSVFVRYARTDTGLVVAAGDFDAALPGGVGPAVAAEARFAFDLRLLPSDTTGGMASVSIDGGPYSDAIPYGVDDGTAQGGMFPAEDFSEAWLLAQVSSASGPGGQIAFRNLRVETIRSGWGRPVDAHLEILETVESADTDFDGNYLLETDAVLNRTLVVTAPFCVPDTIPLFLDFADTLHLPIGLVQAPRGSLTGILRGVADVLTLPDDTLTVNGGTPYDHRITSATVDAQNADSVFVSGSTLR